MITIPSWQSPDEYPHYWVIQEIADSNTLPNCSPDFPYYEAFQPPLYYVISSLIVKIYSDELAFSMKPVNPPLLLIMLRFLSVIAGVLTIYFSYLIYKNIPNIDSKDRLLGIAFLSILPTFVGVTSTVNNDAFVVLFSSISLFYISKPVWTNRNAIWSGFWAGIALLTKLSSAFIVPILLFRIFQFKYVKKNSKIKWIILSITAWSFGFIIFALRNIFQFGNILISDPGFETKFSFSFNHIIWAIRNLLWSFWFAFGRIYEIIPSPLIYIIIILPLLLLAIYAWFKICKVHSNLFQFSIISIILGVFSSLSYTLSYPPGTTTSWGKNLYPILPIIVIFLIVGWNSVFRKHKIIISISTIIVMLISCIWVLFKFHNMLA